MQLTAPKGLLLLVLLLLLHLGLDRHRHHEEVGQEEVAQAIVLPFGAVAATQPTPVAVIGPLWPWPAQEHPKHPEHLGLACPDLQKPSLQQSHGKHHREQHQRSPH